MARQINIALLVVATLCIAIRFLAKWRIAGSEFGWDDWTIFASWLLLIPSTILMQMSSFFLQTVLEFATSADFP